MVGAVSLGNLEGDGQRALLIGAGDGGEALRLFDGGDIADAHHLGLVAGGDLDLQILQRVGGDGGVAAVDQIDRQRFAVQRRLGDLHLAVDLLRDELVHLAHGQIVVGRQLLVHGDAELGHGGFQTVVDLRRALQAAHDFGHVLRHGLQAVDLRAGDIDGDAGAGQHGDIHGAGGNRQLDAHALGRGADVPGDLHIGTARALVHDDVIGQAAGAAHHAHHAAAAAQTDGLHAVDLHHAVHQRQRLILLGLQLGLGIQLQLRGHLGGIYLGHEGRAHLRHLHHGEGQQRHRRQQHQRLDPQRAAQQPGVAALDAGEHALAPGLPLLFQQTRGHGGHHGHRHDQAGQQRKRDGQAQIHKQIVGQSGDEHHGQEHADGGQRGGEQRAGHLAHAVDAGVQDGHVLLVAQSIDVFNGDDGVVHQHADAQRQSRKRQHVERNAREIHAHERRHHAQRNRDGHDDRRPPVHQEQQQHQHRQNAARNQIVQHGIDDDVDVIALIEQVDHRQSALLRHQLGALLSHAVGDVGGGEGGLLLDGQQNAVLAVDLGEGFVGVVGDLHAGHVGQAHLVHGIHADGKQLQPLQFVDGFELVAHAHQIFVVVHVVDIAGGHGQVLRAQQSGHGVHGDDPVQTGVGQRLVALVLKFLARFRQLIRGLGQLGLGLGKGAQRLAARALQLRSGVGQRGILVDAVDQAARDDPLLQLAQIIVDLRDAGLQLGPGLQRGGVLGVERVLVGDQLEQLVFLGLLDLLDGGVQLVQRLARRADGRALAGEQLVDGGDLGAGQLDARVQPGQLALRRLDAGGQTAALHVVQRGLLVGDLRLYSGDFAAEPVDLRLSRLHLCALRRQRLPFRRQLRLKLLQRLSLRAGAEQAAQRSGGRLRRPRFLRHVGQRLGRGGFGGRFRIGGDLRIGRDLRAGNPGRAFGRFEFGDGLLQRVDPGLRGVPGGGFFVQIALGGAQRGLPVDQLRVQRVQVALQGFRVGLAEILDIAAQRITLRQQLLLPANGVGARLAQRGVALSVLQRLQLLLQKFLLALELAQLLLQPGEGGALLVGQIQQRLHAGDALVHLIQLRLQRVPLLPQLRDGGVHLALAAVQLAQRAVQLGQHAALLPGELAFAVGDLRLRLVKLLLHVGQLRVDVPQNGVVQHVDAILLDGHVHLPGDQAGRGDRSHAVDALIRRDQRLLHILRKLVYIHAVPGHGDDGHRQHVRIDLHDRRRADRVAPPRGEHGDFGVDFDHRSVQICGVVELQHHQRQVVAGLRGDVLDVGQRGERRFQRPRDLRLHLFRRGAHIRGVHDDIREIHAGQQIRRHICKRDHAQHNHQDDAYNHRVRFLYAIFSEHASDLRTRSTLFQLYSTPRT